MDDLFMVTSCVVLAAIVVAVSVLTITFFENRSTSVEYDKCIQSEIEASECFILVYGE